MQSLTFERIRSDVAEALQVEPATIKDDDNLADLGIDSMRAMTLLMHWGEQGLDIDFSAFASVPPTLAAWWALAGVKQSKS